jgi:hypothetical protein
METKIINPKTNRWIKIGGKTHQNLEKKGIKTLKKEVPIFKPPSSYKVTKDFKSYRQRQN